MKKNSIKIVLFLNYFVFAILLNSVGIVILKAQKNYGVNEIQASILEAFKDLPIAIVSFLIASFLPRIGYKKAMLIFYEQNNIHPLKTIFIDQFDFAVHHYF